MGKELSFKAKLNDDDKTIDINTIEVKLEKPKDKPKDPPPGRDFTIILSIIVVGIILIVDRLIPANLENIIEPLPPEPEPTNSQNNPTAKSSKNYETVKMYFEKN